MSITTVFANGGSQAVRIPRQYRFDTARVSVQPMNGGVLLMPVRSKPTLEDFFARCDELDEEDRVALSDVRRSTCPQRRELFA